MTDDKATHVIAEVVDAGDLHTIDELCLVCNADADWLTELIEHGVIEPIGKLGAEWRFTSLTIVRIAKAKRLQRDLDLSPAGIAVVLDLLAEMDDLRARLGRTLRPEK